jgi:hypothetical protein
MNQLDHSTGLSMQQLETIGTYAPLVIKAELGVHDHGLGLKYFHSNHRHHQSSCSDKCCRGYEQESGQQRIDVGRGYAAQARGDVPQSLILARDLLEESGHRSAKGLLYCLQSGVRASNDATTDHQTSWGTGRCQWGGSEGTHHTDCSLPGDQPTDMLSSCNGEGGT